MKRKSHLAHQVEHRTSKYLDNVGGTDHGGGDSAGRGLTNHLLRRAAGFKRSMFRPRGREGVNEKLEGFCWALEEAFAIANRDLYRLLLARELIRRVTAKYPATPSCRR